MASIPRVGPSAVPGFGWVHGFLRWLDDDVERDAGARTPAYTPKPVPELEMLEWDGADAAGAARRTHGAPMPADGAELRRRRRDAYVEARFPGIARRAADLQRVDEAIKGARLLFEDGRAEAALELLQLAQEESPREAGFPLARLEILFLMRDAEEFAIAAQAFRERYPAHPAWPEIERLGRALAPASPLFASATRESDHGHYGPWPDLPNWIRAPWDLTAEVMAADFRRAVLRAAG